MNTQQNRFCDLWDRNSSSDAPSVSEKIFQELEALYSQKWRTYHNLKHIDACLTSFDKCKIHAENPDAIELAIWFHDCIYTVGAVDNEAKSKQWFLEKSVTLLSSALRNSIAELIMDTCQTSPPASADGKLLSDIDLGSFCLPWELYIADGQNIQLELTGKESPPGPMHKTGFVKMLAERETVYFSEHYLEKYEAAAQRNIRKHLELVKDWKRKRLAKNQ